MIKIKLKDKSKELHCAEFLADFLIDGEFDWEDILLDD